MKVVGYIRRSTDKQDQSLGDQRRELQRYADEKGYELIRFYEDDAISGTSANGRVGFQEMIRAAEQGNGRSPFQAVLSWDVRRFSRGDNDEAGHYRYRLRKCGVDVIYITENFQGGDSDDLVLATKQWLARQESKDKSKDTLRGLLSCVQSGFSATGHAYGYSRAIIDKTGKTVQVMPRKQASRKCKEDRIKLVPGDSFEIDVVNRIFKSYVGGMGKWSIARMLNLENVPPPMAPRTKKWTCCAIDYITKNPTYVGSLAFNRTTKGKFSNLIKKGEQHIIADRTKINSGKTERRSKSEWVIIKDAHEPIVSKELFEKAQAVRENRKKNNIRGRTNVSPYIWTGLVYCGKCGRRMCGYTQRGVNNRWLYYSCPGCILRGNKKTPAPASKLDDYILKRIEARLAQPDRTAALLKALEVSLAEDLGDPAEKKRTLVDKIKANTEATDQLLDTLDARHRDLINKRLDELRTERERLEGELADLAKAPLDRDPKRLAQELAGYAKDFKRVFAEGTMPERKTFVRTFVHSIVVDAEKREATVGFYRIPTPNPQAVMDGSRIKCSQYQLENLHVMDASSCRACRQNPN